MDQLPCLPRMFIALLLAVLLGSAACSGAASPSAPGSSPAASPAPSGAGPVTSEADAIARVIEHEPRFAGIAKRDPEMIGQSSWYEVAPASGVGAFLVTIRIGWGDCPSGCIDEHSWVYAVAPDGSVTEQSDTGTDVPPDAWPVPGTGGGATTVRGPEAQRVSVVDGRITEVQLLFDTGIR
jgi:hypothetical protein